MLVIIAYDIKDTKERSVVLNKVHKTCRKYLYQIQYSVFYGELTKIQYYNLRLELKKFIKLDLDRITFFTAKNKNNVEIDFIGPIPPIDYIV